MSVVTHVLVCLWCHSRVQVVNSECRAMVGQVAGGGRTEKPLLKAGRAYYKYRAKRNCWPKVRTSFYAVWCLK